MKALRWAALLAGGYLLLAGAWVTFSGSFAASSAHTKEELERIELWKGWGFMVVSSAALFLASRFALRRIEEAGQELVQRERAMIANERRVFAGLIASSVAHDANNVLAVVLTELQLIRGGQIDHATMERIREALDHLVQLNRRLVQAGKQARTSAQPIELTSVVREAVELVRHHPALRRAKLQVELPQPIELNASPVFVSQIVTNLVVNAGEATDGKGRVTVRTRHDEERAVLEVQDDGPGIAAERRPGLFDALVTTKAAGSGMGLFSVKAAATAMGGTVSVDEAPGGGALFRIALPLRLGA
ncbi:MAG: HAMP domain-containing histidine kinase [Myxococcales bacterium]|nr:HAMP domain-containing histidine kinase [Myxococcales bacterium]